MRSKGRWEYEAADLPVSFQMKSSGMKNKLGRMKHVAFIFFLFFFQLYFFSQDTLPKNIFSPALNLYFGYLPKTYPIAPESRYSIMTSAQIFWQFNGKDKWHQYYHFPKGGIEILYGTFDNPSELGYTAGLVPTLEINSKNPKRSWRAKFGIGVTYFNKTYDPIVNTQNYYIGAHFTNMTTAGFTFEKKLGKRLSASYGLAIIHCSDGHTRLPNVGLNLFMLETRIGFIKPAAKKVYELTEEKNKLSYAVKLGLGLHQFGATEKAVGGPGYPSYHLSSWVSKPYRNIHLLQAGFTFAYYTSFYDYITSQEVDFKNAQLSSCTGLLFAGHEFVFGKFSLSTQAGFYFFNPFFIRQKKIEGRWHVPSEKLEAFNTNRVGLIYYPLKKRNSLNNVKNQLMFGAFIKANLAQADLFEFSIGYVF